MRLAFLLVEDSYQHNVNRLLAGCADGPQHPIARIALEMTAPRRHNGAHPSNKDAPMIPAPSGIAWCAKSDP
jgi:hypothetical protein